MIRKKTILTFILVLFITSSSSITAFSYQDVIEVDSVNDDGLVNYRAVFVGIGKSQGLPYSVRQINGFSTTLTRGRLFKEENIKTLFDEQATKSAIKNELQWLANNSDNNDVALFYFVGHGSITSTNAFIHAFDHVIVDEELAVFIENITGSLVVILDSCYSGGLIKELEGDNRTIITACADDEPTYQVHDLKSGMFGFFLNLSFAWCTKNIEAAFIVAKITTKYYSNKLSNEFEEDYRVYPQISDNDQGLTWLLFKHSYGKQLFSLIKQMIDTDGFNPLWRMR